MCIQDVEIVTRQSDARRPFRNGRGNDMPAIGSVAELLAADVPAPIAAAEAGWRVLPGRSPVLSGLARLIHDRPDLVTGPLAATPHTFLHGDWKTGNLGTHPDGRTILLDWA